MLQISVTRVTAQHIVTHVTYFDYVFLYSGTSPYGHLTSKKTSPLQSPWLSLKLYSTVQMPPCNKDTSPLRSLLTSPVSDLNSEVPLYQKYWLRSMNVCSSADTSLEQPQIYRIMACYKYLSK